jgi:hypothetical protein
MMRTRLGLGVCAPLLRSRGGEILRGGGTPCGPQDAEAGEPLGRPRAIVVVILLMALTIATFGGGATDGPLQVALMLSAAFAGLVALKNGYTSAALADAAVGGVSRAVGAIFIQLPPSEEQPPSTRADPGQPAEAW